MDRLEAMSIFLSAVETGSLSSAGRKRRMPLATISRKIAELEAHIGTRLFVRTGRKLSLTDAGSAYVIACRRILDDVEAAERAASGEYSIPKGDLSLAAPIVFGRLHVLPLVVEFLTLFPQINIRLVLADRMAAFAEDHIDLAIRIGDLPDSSLIATRIGLVRRVLCASPGYFERAGMPTSLEALKTHDCITFDWQSASHGWQFMAGNTAQAVPVRCRLLVNTAEAAIDAARAGLGLTRVLSYQVANALKQGELKLALEDFEPAPSPIHLVYAGERLVPLKLRSFLDFVTPRLKARLAG